MAKMSFTVSQAKSVEKNLKKQAVDLQHIKGELTGDINTVKEWWKGASQTAFIDQYDEFKDSLDQLSDLAENVAEQLNKIAELKMETEARIAGMFGKR